MTARAGRRGVLAAGVLAAAAGCSTGRAPDRSSGDAPTNPAPSETPSVTPPVIPPVTPSAAPSTADFDQLARTISGTLALPGTSTYDVARLTENPRYDDARPLAVLSVAGAADVAAAFAFAQDHGVAVAIRSGGHSYPGWSAGAGRLVVDVRPLDTVTLDGTLDSKRGDPTATIGAGASLVATYAALASQGRGIAAGSCPTVGVAGLTLGGGVGVLTRAHGLTCDAVTAMQVVLADGRVVTASCDTEPDLFWALRGGGGGHLGVVTSFTTATFAAPTITTAYLAWPISAATEVIPAFLDAVPGADPSLWATLKLLGGTARASGPTMLASVTWVGEESGLDAALAPFLSQVPSPQVDSRHVRGYLDQMLAYAGCSAIPATACHTGSGGRLDREAFAATSHIISTSTGTDVDALLSQVQAAQDSGLTEAGISIDALGGVVDDVGPGDTAFGHRGALATVQYTATYAAPYSVSRGRRAQAYVEAFRTAMTPSWGTGAYVNYAQVGLADASVAYFGDNAARLARVRTAYDPVDFFTQPQGY